MTEQHNYVGHETLPNSRPRNSAPPETTEAQSQADHPIRHAVPNLPDPDIHTHLPPRRFPVRPQISAPQTEANPPIQPAAGRERRLLSPMEIRARDFPAQLETLRQLMRRGN